MNFENQYRIRIDEELEWPKDFSWHMPQVKRWWLPIWQDLLYIKTQNLDHAKRTVRLHKNPGSDKKTTYITDVV